MEKVKKDTQQCPKIIKRLQKDSTASGASFINLNSMGANYLTQKYGVEKITKKGFECIDVQLFNTIILGQIISPHKIHIIQRCFRCWKNISVFFFIIFEHFVVILLFFPKKKLGF